MRANTFKYKERIKEILQANARARDFDVVLYAELLKGPPVNFDLAGRSARELLMGIFDGELPHIESVRRTRQLIQAAHPELRGTRQRQRKADEQEWREKVKQGIGEPSSRSASRSGWLNG